MARYDAPKTMDQKMVAEFLGTFLLVFTWCSQSMAGSALGALAVASILMVSVYSLGSVSGANFNPAVSLGLRLADKLGPYTTFSTADMGLYWGAQLAGGILGAISSGYVFQSVAQGPASWIVPANSSSVIEHEGTFDPVGMNALGAGPGFTLWSVFVGEMVYTAVLVLVVLNVATRNDQGSNTKNHYFGLAIGFVIVAGALSIGYISQCSLNPAVTLGVTVGAQIFQAGAEQALSTSLQIFAVYASGELLGAVVAAGLFHLLRKYSLRDGEVTAPMSSKLLAEFLGTFVLVLTVSMVVEAPTSSPIGILGIASSLMVMIYALGAVSGANFNPAVSFGILLSGGLTPREFGLYVVAQILGGLAAVLTAIFFLGSWNSALVGGNVHPNIAQGSWGMIAGSEIMYTFVLVFVVLNVALGPDAPNQYYGLAIGFVILAGGVAVGQLSGGMFNPAVALSIDLGVVINNYYHKTVETAGGSIFYAGFELVGAALAAGIFRFLYKNKGEDESSDDGEEELVGDA